jgi:HTH DNA binding domain.
MFERKLEGRRTSSKLPGLVDLVMAKPLVSATMVAKTLEVTPQAARRIVLELGLREMTGRGRFGLSYFPMISETDTISRISRTRQLAKNRFRNGETF